MTDAHPWQEYNEHGNTCHYPGCRLPEDEHAVEHEVTSLADLARGVRVFLKPDGTQHTEPID